MLLYQFGVWLNQLLTLKLERCFQKSISTFYSKWLSTIRFTPVYPPGMLIVVQAKTKGTKYPKQILKLSKK